MSNNTLFYCYVLSAIAVAITAIEIIVWHSAMLIHNIIFEVEKCYNMLFKTLLGTNN
jgi:vacuolar-type H+-ATPase subunit I/STV1